MISLLSVIAGCRPNSCAVLPPGVPPYSMMPARTQSLSTSGCSRSAAELARLTSAAIPALPALKRRTCSASGKPGIGGIVGIGKMRHQGDFLYCGNRAHPLIRGMEGVRHETQAVHAAVHFQVDVQWRSDGGLLDHLDLLVAVDRELELMFDHRFQVDRLKKTFQQQDRLFPAHFPQAHRAIDFNQRQAVGLGKSPQRACQSVTVGVCLDHAPNLGCGRMRFRDS